MLRFGDEECDFEIEVIPDCETPTENYPYNQNTFAKIEELAPLILFYSQMYGVSPIAVAGSIADEYNTQRGLKGIVDWGQDILLGQLPNFSIQIDDFFNFESKLLNAMHNDVGIGNINIETAVSIYNSNVEYFENKNWDYSDIINYLATNEGAVHIATLVIKRAQNILSQDVSLYPLPLQEAVLMTYYKQGDSYIDRYRANGTKSIRPGEGCRLEKQRAQIIKSLYKL